MNKGKKIGLVVLFVLIAVQFIRPAQNRNNMMPQTDLVTKFNVPASVAGILKGSCYDCHSNNTRYPWYSHVQPIGWLLAKHIKDGKKELNFNEFTTYSRRRQVSKLKSIQNTIKDGSMPLPSYTLLHRDAKLSEESKTLLMHWATKAIDSLSR